MIFPTLEGKIFQLCLKSDIFPTLTPNTNKISTQTKNVKFPNSDQKMQIFSTLIKICMQCMHAMYALMTSLVLSFVLSWGVKWVPGSGFCPRFTEAELELWEFSLLSCGNFLCWAVGIFPTICNDSVSDTMVGKIPTDPAPVNLGQNPDLVPEKSINILPAAPFSVVHWVSRRKDQKKKHSLA